MVVGAYCDHDALCRGAHYFRAIERHFAFHLYAFLILMVIKRLSINILLFILTVVLVFAIGEGLCRVFVKPPMTIVEKFSEEKPTGEKSSYKVNDVPDALYQYTAKGGMRLAPNAHILIENHFLSHRDVGIDTNSLGFRSAEVPANKGNESKVLVLGDSITLGDYEDEPNTYPARIEHHLKKNGKNFRVINAGIGSADVVNEYKILADSGVKTSPDIVLLGLYLNDGELSANFVVRPLPKILRWSYFADFLNRRVQLSLFRLSHRAELAGEGSPWVKEFVGGRNLSGDLDWMSDKNGFDYLVVKNIRDWGAAWNPKTWDILKEYIAKMQELSHRNNFKFAVMLLPVRYQVEADYLYNDPQQTFDLLMKELQIPHLDLLPILRASWQSDPTVKLYYDKCHLTALGNDIIGKAAAGFLLGRVDN